MTRGLWLCIDSTVMRKAFSGVQHPAPNSDGAARGSIPVPATNGCGFWNVYVSRIDDTDFTGRGFYVQGVGIPKPRKIDTRCRHCNRRVRFTAENVSAVHRSRWDDRGRVRPVRWQKYAENTILQVLIDEANLRNRGEQVERDEIRFVRAKNYRKV